MAIIERKQLTGSTAKINQYAGHEGQLVFDTQTKHLHVLSGTAGTNTKLANVSDIPAPQDISGKADKTYVDQQLAKKQPTGDYATNAQLTQGLAGKAPSVHTHTKSQITDFPEIPDTSTLIPKTGNRGVLNGVEVKSTLNIINDVQPEELPDSVWCNPSVLQMSIKNPKVSDITFTKVIFGMGSGGSGITLDTSWNWPDGKAISYKDGGFVVVLHWNGSTGLVNLINY